MEGNDIGRFRREVMSEERPFRFNLANALTALAFALAACFMAAGMCLGVA